MHTRQSTQLSDKRNLKLLRIHRENGRDDRQARRRAQVAGRHNKNTQAECNQGGQAFGRPRPRALTPLTPLRTLAGWIGGSP